MNAFRFVLPLIALVALSAQTVRAGADNAETYGGTWAYGNNQGTGFGAATYVEGTGGGIFLETGARRIDGNGSFGMFSGSGGGNSQAGLRTFTDGFGTGGAYTAGTLTLSARFDLSNTVAFSGFNLKNNSTAPGTFGSGELVSFGLTPGTGNNSIFVDGLGASTSINLGSSIPGQIVDFRLTFDAIAGTYTLEAKFRASGTFSSVSGNLNVANTSAIAFGFANFNTGNSQNLIFDSITMVPEPGTVLAGVAALGVVAAAIRRRRQTR